MKQEIINEIDFCQRHEFLQGLSTGILPLIFQSESGKLIRVIQAEGARSLS